MGGRPAAFGTKLDSGRLRCGLCPKACVLAPGEVGQCRTRRNDNGELISLTYGRLKASAVDPIEKKPLFHFHPGSESLSVASAGCNLVCPFCQNYSLSQALNCADNLDAGMDGRITRPEEVVEAAKSSGCASISFTYSEPVLQFEFARDVAEIAHQSQIDIVYVSNGQITARACRELAAFCDGANIDLKSFSEDSYKETLGGNLKATLKAIEILAESGCWVEVTTLLIPEFNDSDAELTQIAEFIAKINHDIPWHVSRFHPDYRWTNHSRTSTDLLHRALDLGKKAGLNYVYVGNLPGDTGENTYCPNCNALVIERRGFTLHQKNLSGENCSACGHAIAGRGLTP